MNERDESRERDEAKENPQYSMDANLKWDLVECGDYNGLGSTETRRMSVPGGWLVWVTIVYKLDSDEDAELDVRSSVTFVEDKAHAWTI